MELQWLLMTATGAIVWHCDADGRFDAPQAAWSAFTGHGNEHALGRCWLDAVDPSDRAATGAAWDAARASASRFETRHRLRRGDGTIAHTQVTAIPLFDQSGMLSQWMGVHTDISGRVAADTERERLLREVQAANDRMIDIFQQAPAFICVLRGPDHIYEIINAQYRQLVGNRDLVGQPVRSALPELEGQGFFDLLDGVYRSGEPFVGFDLPVMLQREPGMPLEERFIDLVYMALRDADGEITGLLAHGVDQTHRKNAEQALQASRERFEKLVSQAATGVVEMDIDGRFLFVNQRFAQMLGYAPAELIGRHALDVTAPDSVKSTSDAIAKLLTLGDGVAIEKQYVRKDGSLMAATSSINALRAPDGSYQGIMAVVLDVSDVERTASELRASEERFRTLFESMDQGFCVIEMFFDERGDPADYRFIEMNRMFEHHTGLTGASGKTALELLPGLDRFWIDMYGQVALTGEAARFENTAPAMDRSFEVFATRIGGAGSARVALLFSDITARKKDSDALRTLAAHLSEADQRKTEFLATLAHELRNPLAPIRSGLGVLRVSEDQPAVVARVGAMMERQVGHMVHLIDDLLDIARISGGKLQLKKNHAELGQAIASAIETSLPVIEAGRHALHVDVQQHGFSADIDVTRIAQVVANLLNNAAKYTPSGGAIDLTMRRDGTDAVIAVSDSGVGIAGEALDGVFDMFSQIGDSIDRAQGGLGIGLSLARRLVELHGGSISAASAGAGTGSTFTIRLPLAGAAQSAHADHGAAQPSGEPAREVAATPAVFKILVVDDNVDAAVTLSMILELHGHSTQLAHDGIEAIESLETFMPQLAFMDIGMPRMNGYETATAMRREQRSKDICLVALTGWGAESDREKSRQAGFDYHLTKPVQLSDIERILQQYKAALPGRRA